MCICDLAVLGLVASYVYDRSSHFRSVKKTPAEPASEVDLMAQSESEELQKAKREYIAQEKAFQSMLNFNIEQAYGMQQEPAEE